MHGLTGFQRDLLYVIAGQDQPHGLAIKDELEDNYEQKIHPVGCIRTSMPWWTRASSRRASSTGGPTTMPKPNAGTENSKLAVTGNNGTSKTQRSWHN